MYVEQNIAKQQNLGNILLRGLDQNYAVSIGVWEAVAQMLMEASMMQRQLLSKGYDILIMKSLEELNGLFRSRLTKLGLIGGFLSVLVLGLFFLFKLKEENEIRTNTINVIKIFFIIPQYIVFKNRSMHFILQRILENDF